MNTQKEITKEEYSELIHKWNYKKISTKQLIDALKGTKYEPKKEDFNEYDNNDSECCCLDCDKCWERIKEGSYSNEDWFGEDWYKEWND